MNVATVAPLPAAALMRAEAMRVLVLLRPTMARFAPSAASASAAANPMPLVAPVIRDLLVVHGTAIQCYGDARVTCPMVEDLTIDHGVSEQRLKTRTGVQVVVKHTHSDRRFQGRGCLRYASKHLHSRAGSNQCAP